MPQSVAGIPWSEFDGLNDSLDEFQQTICQATPFVRIVSDVQGCRLLVSRNLLKHFTHLHSGSEIERQQVVDQDTGVVVETITLFPKPIVAVRFCSADEAYVAAGARFRMTPRVLELDLRSHQLRFNESSVSPPDCRGSSFVEPWLCHEEPTHPAHRGISVRHFLQAEWIDLLAGVRMQNLTQFQFRRFTETKELTGNVAAALEASRK